MHGYLNWKFDVSLSNLLKSLAIDETSGNRGRTAHDPDS
jgi:hypothetical protein